MILINSTRGDKMEFEIHEICATYDTLKQAILKITSTMNQVLTKFINESGSIEQLDPDKIIWKFDNFLYREYGFSLSTCSLKPRLKRIITNLKENKDVNSDLLKGIIKKISMNIVVSFWNAEVNKEDLKQLEELDYDGSFGHFNIQVSYFKYKWQQEKEKREKLEKKLEESKEVQKVLIDEYRAVFLEGNKELKNQIDVVKGLLSTQNQVLKGVEEKTFAMDKNVYMLPKRVSTIVAATIENPNTVKKQNKGRVKVAA